MKGCKWGVAYRNANQGGGTAWLMFVASCVDGKNRIDGTLLWLDKNPDGSVSVYGQYSARSGSKVLNSIPTGHVYTLSNYRDRTTAGMVVDGIGFSADISPDPFMGRTDLRIHPDGGPPGTAGCIGLTGDDEELTEFQNRIQAYLSQHGTVSRPEIGLHIK